MFLAGPKVENNGGAEGRATLEGRLGLGRSVVLVGDWLTRTEKFISLIFNEGGFTVF